MLLMTLLVGDEGDDDSFRGDDDLWWRWQDQRRRRHLDKSQVFTGSSVLIWFASSQGLSTGHLRSLHLYLCNVNSFNYTTLEWGEWFEASLKKQIANRTFERWSLFLVAFQQCVSHICKQKKRHRTLTNTNTQIRIKYLVDYNWTAACTSDLDPTIVKGNVFAHHLTLLPSYHMVVIKRLI